MDYIKLIAVLFGATGFWKLIELFIKLRSDKKKQAAEIKNLQAQTETSVVGNWMLWAQALEKRIKELETVAEENKELIEQIEKQRKRICELEAKVDKVEIENKELRKEMGDLGNHEQSK